MLAEQRVAVVYRALAAARAHLKQAEDLFGHGMAVNSDVLRTNVLVGGLEQDRIQAESRLNIALGNPRARARRRRQTTGAVSRTG